MKRELGGRGRKLGLARHAWTCTVTLSHGKTTVVLHEKRDCFSMTHLGLLTCREQLTYSELYQETSSYKEVVPSDETVQKFLELGRFLRIPP